WKSPINWPTGRVAAATVCRATLSAAFDIATRPWLVATAASFGVSKDAADPLAAGSGRGTANGFDFTVSISIVRGPQNGNQSFGGAEIPQTFPGSSSSIAVSKSPPCSPVTHFTRPRAVTGFVS